MIFGIKFRILSEGDYTNIWPDLYLLYCPTRNSIFKRITKFPFYDRPTGAYTERTNRLVRQQAAQPIEREPVH